jgi:hypothetical protein
VSADELAEDLPLELGGDSDAFVLNADADDAVLSPSGDVDDAALGRVLDCVRKQVRNHLGEAIRVAAYSKWCLRQRHVQEVFRALARKELRLLANDGADVDQLLRDRQVALLETLDVQEVVDEGGEPAGLRFDDAEVLPALVVGDFPLPED